MPEFDFGSLSEEKEIPPEVKKTEKISEKISPEVRLIEKDFSEISEINKSLELNLIKCLYANRFGSTTNKTKDYMIRKIKNVLK